MLRAAREARGLDQADVAERLNWILSYVSIIERDDYAALRRPSFAGGYVRAYGKLLGLNGEQLMAAYRAVVGEVAEHRPAQAPPRKRRARVAPMIADQHLLMVLGLLILVLLVLILGWWRGDSEAAPAPAMTVLMVNLQTDTV